MQYYVVYQDWDIVRGPVDRDQAEALMEDLNTVLNDPDYKVLDEYGVMGLSLIDPPALAASFDY